MPAQAAPGFFDDRHGITPAARLDVQVEVKTFIIANAPEKVDERPVALPFNPDEDNLPAVNPTRPPHPASTESRKPTEDADPVLGIQTNVTPQTSDILSTVNPGGPAVVFLDDEDLLLLKIVEQAGVM